MIQNAIDFAFPLTTHPLLHGVFTEQLLLARAQASAWVEVLEPLYEILSLAGVGGLGMRPDLHQGHLQQY